MYVCWIYKLILDCDRFNEVFPDHKYIFFFFLSQNAYISKTMSANIEVKFHFILQVTDELCSEDSVSILFSRTVFLTSGEVTEALRVAVM